MKPTTKLIAELSGFSRGTVDRALNGKPGVNALTREKICRVAKQIGYRPHHIARSLVTGRSMTIGLVLFDLEHRFFTQMVTSLDREARAAGYFVVPALTNKNPAEEMRCIERHMALNVDGFVLFSIRNDEGFVAYLRGLGKPIVTIGNRIDTLPFVGIDDFAAARDAVRHIAAKGYRRIVYLSPPLRRTNGANRHALIERCRGYAEGLRETLPHAREMVVQSADYRQELVHIVRQGPPQPAILCTSDIYAVKALKALRQAGHRVPGHAGLMGFDNIDLLSFIEPRLTTVDYHIDTIACTAFGVLRGMIDHGQNGDGAARPGDHTVPYEIIQGESL
jgi:DNA-binding LacI/PurR family transcriptional regulator